MENVWYDADILTALQSRGKGYQTRINKICSRLTDNRAVAIFHRFNKFRTACTLRCFTDFFNRCIRPSDTDIVQHGIIKQKHILKYKTDIL